MLKTEFKDKLEFDLYKSEQTIRMEKGYLSRSERETLKKMLDENYKPIFIEVKKIDTNIKPIVTDIYKLRVPGTKVANGQNIKQIIAELKTTLNKIGGVGLSANQIGYTDRISYIKIPRFTKDKKIEFAEMILINAKIIEQDRLIRVQNEGCLSFPGVFIDTQRFVFATVEYLNEKLEVQTAILQDLEAICVQHEVDHQNGVTLFDRKWRSK